MKYTRTAIRCLETGEVFVSAAELSHVLGMSRASISNHLAGRYPTLKGLTFVRHDEPVQPIHARLRELEIENQRLKKLEDKDV